MNYPSLSNHTGGFKAIKLLFVVLALLVAGLLVYGTYLWQQREVDSLNQKISTLNAQIKQSKNSDTTTTQNQVPEQTMTYTSLKGVSIKLFRPEKGDLVTTPLVVMGEVPGNWSFEASFPVKLLDSNGKVLADETAELQADWMTDSMVPFVTKLTYNANDVTKGTTGKLVLTKDNPSGLEKNDDSLTIEVKF